MLRTSLLATAAWIGLGGSIDAQYYGEPMAPPPPHLPFTEPADTQYYGAGLTLPPTRSRLCAEVPGLAGVQLMRPSGALLSGVFTAGSTLGLLVTRSPGAYVVGIGLMAAAGGFVGGQVGHGLHAAMKTVQRTRLGCYASGWRSQLAAVENAFDGGPVDVVGGPFRDGLSSLWPCVVKGAIREPEAPMASPRQNDCVLSRGFTRPGGS